LGSDDANRVGGIGDFAEPSGIQTKTPNMEGLLEQDRAEFWEKVAFGIDYVYNGIHIGLDIAGTIDSTPTCDIIHAAGYLGEGRYGDAGWTATGMLPLGYVFKVGKYAGKYADEAVELIRVPVRGGENQRLQMVDKLTRNLQKG